MIAKEQIERRLAQVNEKLTEAATLYAVQQAAEREAFGRMKQLEGEARDLRYWLGLVDKETPLPAPAAPTDGRA
jgi:hypothetical protein